jgi:hypothetical protein
MLLDEANGLPAVIRLGNHFEVAGVFDDPSKSGPHNAVVIRQ